MSLRFWKRKKILPGITINFSKTGISISFGTRGIKFTKTIIGKRKKGERITIGIPGTGIFYTKRINRKK